MSKSNNLFIQSLLSFSNAKTFAGRAKLDRRLWVKTAVLWNTYLFTFFSRQSCTCTRTVILSYILHSVEIFVSYPQLVYSCTRTRSCTYGITEVRKYFRRVQLLNKYESTKVLSYFQKYESTKVVSKVRK